MKMMDIGGYLINPSQVKCVTSDNKYDESLKRFVQVGVNVWFDPDKRPLTLDGVTYKEFKRKWNEAMKGTN